MKNAKKKQVNYLFILFNALFCFITSKFRFWHASCLISYESNYEEVYYVETAITTT